MPDQFARLVHSTTAVPHTVHPLARELIMGNASRRRRNQAVRSTPGSHTDQTMSKLASLREELVAEAQARHEKALAYRAGMSKSARKRAARRASQPLTGNTGPIEVPVGGTRPGELPKFNTGSIQVMPASGKISRPKGMRLQVMSDYIPGNPGDWTDHTRRSSAAASRAILKPHWSSDMPDRDSLARERAKVVTRSYREQCEYDSNGTNIHLHAQTGAQRDRDDAARGVMRDGLGRVIRTTDMPDCEVELVKVRRKVVRFGQETTEVEVEEFRVRSGRTPLQHAQAMGLPGTRRLRDVVTEEKWEKQQDKAQRKADKADLRAEKANLRQQAKAEAKARKAERPQVISDEAREDALARRRELRTLARNILAHRGITKPTNQQIKGMLEFFEMNQQKARMIQGRLAKAA